MRETGSDSTEYTPTYEKLREVRENEPSHPVAFPMCACLTDLPAATLHLSFNQRKQQKQSVRPAPEKHQPKVLLGQKNNELAKENVNHGI